MVAAGIFWALLIFDETLGLWVWAALACMVVGLWLVNTGARRRHGDSLPILSRTNALAAVPATIGRT